MTQALQAQQAHALYSALVSLKHEAMANILKIGQCLSELKRDQMWKILGYESFRQFLAAPELDIKEKTAYSYIGLYELYIEDLKLDSPPLERVGHRKLQIIKPVVKLDPEEWVTKAQELSCSDLQAEVREATGKHSLPPFKRREPEDVGLGTGDDSAGQSYLAYVKSHPCILHPSRPAERAHFPKTTGAGAPNWHVIPLCRECHTEYHAIGVVEWFAKYRNPVMQYFYTLIGKFYDTRREMG